MWSFGTTFTIAQENKGDSEASSSPPSSQASQTSLSTSASKPSTSSLANATPPSTTAVTDPPPCPASMMATAAMTAGSETPGATSGRPPIFSERSMKQLGLFFAGAGFLAMSTLVTRRSVARKISMTRPSFYQPSNHPVTKLDTDSSLIALEALNLATLNVVGFGIMMTGGVSWAFDISSVDDLRGMARRHVGPGGGRTDEEAEREVEEWVAKILGRKEEREQQTANQSKKNND